MEERVECYENECLLIGVVGGGRLEKDFDGRRFYQNTARAKILFRQTVHLMQVTQIIHNLSYLHVLEHQCATERI